MDVSVVITCWNGRKLLEKNLPSVLAASENSKNNICEIIVVDDGSTDDSVNYINKFKVKLVRHRKNIGYSATCNTGVKEASGELVAILNLDVIPSLNFLEFSLPHFEDGKVFAVSFNEGKYGPGKLEWKGGFLEIVPSEISQQTQESDWASGGSSIFRKKIWEDLEGMDEIFLPFYFEDIDLGLRAKKRGYKCLWEPMSKVDHKHESTINKNNFDVNYINSVKERNHLLLTWKNINSPFRFLSHSFYLPVRCFLKPGYLKVVLSALNRSAQRKHLYSSYCNLQ